MDDSVDKDVAYSPASETETQHKQSTRLPESVDDDIDAEAVKVAPGTGGPDDVGDIEVDPSDINLPTGDDDEPELEIVAESEITRRLLDQEARDSAD